VRLAARVAKLEAKRPPPAVGCDVCRGRLILGLGEYVEHQEAGGYRYTCAACGRDLSGCKFIAVDMRDVL
jgi:hypothetical protein